MGEYCKFFGGVVFFFVCMPDENNKKLPKYLNAWGVFYYFILTFFYFNYYFAMFFVGEGVGEAGYVVLGVVL